MKRRLQFLSLAALALAAVVVAAPTASAQDVGTADLVIVHGLRGFTVDLYVDGKLLINTFRLERSTDPMAVPAGSHLVEIREAGTGVDTTPAVTATIDLAAGNRYDAVAHVDQAGAPMIGPVAAVLRTTVLGLSGRQRRDVVEEQADHRCTGLIDVGHRVDRLPAARSMVGADRRGGVLVAVRLPDLDEVRSCRGRPSGRSSARAGRC